MRSVWQVDVVLAQLLICMWHDVVLDAIIAIIDIRRRVASRFGRELVFVEGYLSVWLLNHHRTGAICWCVEGRSSTSKKSTLCSDRIVMVSIFEEWDLF